VLVVLTTRAASSSCARCATACGRRRRTHGDVSTLEEPRLVIRAGCLATARASVTLTDSGAPCRRLFPEHHAVRDGLAVLEEHEKRHSPISAEVAA